MDEIERLVWTEAPGALYVDNHGVFEEVKIDFKYVGQGIFHVTLKGNAEIETPFEVSATIPLEVVLKAYDKRATKEDILNFFDKISQKNSIRTENTGMTIYFSQPRRKR